MVFVKGIPYSTASDLFLIVFHYFLIELFVCYNHYMEINILNKYLKPYSWKDKKTSVIDLGL